MKTRYNHAPNDSPRSGSNKLAIPMLWGGLVVVIVLLAVWFVTR